MCPSGRRYRRAQAKLPAPGMYEPRGGGYYRPSTAGGRFNEADFKKFETAVALHVSKEPGPGTYDPALSMTSELDRQIGGQIPPPKIRCSDLEDEPPGPAHYHPDRYRQIIGPAKFNEGSGGCIVPLLAPMLCRVWVGCLN